jgi:hypothetical protein
MLFGGELLGRIAIFRDCFERTHMDCVAIVHLQFKLIGAIIGDIGVGKSIIDEGGGIDGGCDSADSSCELMYISGLGKGTSERERAMFSCIPYPVADTTRTVRAVSVGMKHKKSEVGKG